jgi:hypothetical protein
VTAKIPEGVENTVIEVRRDFCFQSPHVRTACANHFVQNYENRCGIAKFLFIVVNINLIILNARIIIDWRRSALGVDGFYDLGLLAVLCTHGFSLYAPQRPGVLEQQQM